MKHKKNLFLWLGLSAFSLEGSFCYGMDRYEMMQQKEDPSFSEEEDLGSYSRKGGEGDFTPYGSEDNLLSLLGQEKTLDKGESWEELKEEALGYNSDEWQEEDSIVGGEPFLYGEENIAFPQIGFSGEDTFPLGKEPSPLVSPTPVPQEKEPLSLLPPTPPPVIPTESLPLPKEPVLLEDLPPKPGEKEPLKRRRRGAYGGIFIVGGVGVGTALLLDYLWGARIQKRVTEKLKEWCPPEEDLSPKSLEPSGFPSAYSFLKKPFSPLFRAQVGGVVARLLIEGGGGTVAALLSFFFLPRGK
jgi:hypothetical protein